MRRRPSLPSFLAIATVLGLTGTACAGPGDPGPAGSTTTTPTSTTGATSIAADSVIVDVRTPAEFAEGHLAGAVNLDVQSATFAQDIALLPTDGAYVVYCRSGNRSAQAAAQMQSAGFTNVMDAGSLQDAAQTTGLDITS